MKKRASIKINVDEIAEVAGTTIPAVWMASYRKRFDINNFESIVIYINRTRKKKGLPKLGGNVS